MDQKKRNSTFLIVLLHLLKFQKISFTLHEEDTEIKLFSQDALMIMPSIFPTHIRYYVSLVENVIFELSRLECIGKVKEKGGK